MIEGRIERRIYSSGGRTIISISRFNKQGGIVFDLLMLDKLPSQQPAQMKLKTKK